MGEVHDITPKILDHWTQYYEQSLRQVELCEQQLARIALETSGQLEIQFEPENMPDLPEAA